jgi:hypothetical protein
LTTPCVEIRNWLLRPLQVRDGNAQAVSALHALDFPFMTDCMIPGTGLGVFNSQL